MQRTGPFEMFTANLTETFVVCLCWDCVGLYFFSVSVDFTEIKWYIPDQLEMLENYKLEYSSGEEYNFLQTC